MEVLGFVFGSTGMTFGIIALASATTATHKIAKLEKRLRDAGILEEESEAD